MEKRYAIPLLAAGMLAVLIGCVSLSATSPDEACLSASPEPSVMARGGIVERVFQIVPPLHRAIWPPLIYG